MTRYGRRDRYPYTLTYQTATHRRSEDFANRADFLAAYRREEPYVLSYSMPQGDPSPEDESR